MSTHPKAIAFAGDTRIAEGELSSVALAACKALARPRHDAILVFDATTSETIELDLRGTPDQVLRRLPAPAREPSPPRGPGRPKLGVIAREVTLLPRHWSWLASQPGGASVALRKLVEHGMRANAGKDRIRASQNTAYRFMSVMAGNRPGFEDASRALFAGDEPTFTRLIDGWPPDICNHVKTLAADALRARENAE
jgi:hypothetical protein